MKFSRRIPKNLSLNPISKILESIPTNSILDLTQSNPTQCGFDYPPDLLKTLSSPLGLNYEPLSFGNLKARQAVKEYLENKGQTVQVENILLTASTSEAYSYLFKLLADPGDSFLVPTPGYPLLDLLIQLEGLKLVNYSLKTESLWPIDWSRLERVVNHRPRGLIVINPHNPTGSFMSHNNQKNIGDFCRIHDLAYISDEVFADYLYPGQTIPQVIPEDVLSFRLGGLSKSLGLPQLKLSWIILNGPHSLLAECRKRLELIADTYLSVGTPVQLALKELFLFAPNFQKQLMKRILTNRTYLIETFKGIEIVKVWPAQGGWYALLEILKVGQRDDDWVIELLKKDRVFIHPGGFYDFEKGCFLVLSLLPEPNIFCEGVNRMAVFFSKKNL